MTHLTNPDEKELVKQELSKRYYNHYFSIGTTAGQAPAVAPPAPAETPPPAVADTVRDEPPTDLQNQTETEGKAAEALSLDEELAGITEIRPIKPKLSASQKTAADLVEEITSKKTAKRKFCFIATAAYGSSLAQEVVLLQDFRDRYLSRNPLGEKFIQVYYRSSPYLARPISRSQILRQLTRCLLTPVIFLIKKAPGVDHS